MGEAVRMTRGRNKGVDSLGVEIDRGIVDCGGDNDGGCLSPIKGVSLLFLPSMLVRLLSLGALWFIPLLSRKFSKFLVEN